jgi:hypothetical protein
MWQGPGLALAAQAFLLTVALAHDTSRFGRVVATALALVTVFAAAQLIRRKKWQIDAFEREIAEDLHALFCAGNHNNMKNSSCWGVVAELNARHTTLKGRRGYRASKWPAPAVWISMLLLFGVADAVIAASAYIVPSAL